MDINQSPQQRYEAAEAQDSGKANGLEILVAIFFFVAAAWLLVAVFYALLALLVFRLRARGLLDLDDADFGHLYLFGRRGRSRFYIPCGCILRRYVIAFGHDDQSSTNHGRGPNNQRHMSRSERRRAIKKILSRDTGGGQGRYSSIETQQPDSFTHGQCQAMLEEGLQQNENDNVETSSPQEIPTNEEPGKKSAGDDQTCSICLAEYEEGDRIYKSNVCDHFYHWSCIVSWLERRANTECPCCRHPIVSDAAVWEAVEASRKEVKVLTKKQKNRPDNNDKKINGREKEDEENRIPVPLTGTVEEEEEETRVPALAVAGETEGEDDGNHTRRPSTESLLVSPGPVDAPVRGSCEDNECQHLQDTRRAL